MLATATFIFVTTMSAFWGGPREARILRYPDIHENSVAFVYGGDIYLAEQGGGPALQLTSHEGRELFPKFSPDGQWLAFSGEYNGTRQVFVIHRNGGQPKQLTYYNDVGAMPPRGGFDYQVLDWTPDGKQVLFRGNRLPWGIRMGKYFTVPVDGGTETALEIPEGGTGMFSPDGKKMVYTPIAREFRTWKRHRGGRAQDVWIYDLEQQQSERLTDHVMTDNMPVWVGDTIYFTSDRDYTLNLFRYDTKSKQLEKQTNHNDFDVLWPSAGPKRIVYEHSGYLRIFDPASGKDEKMTVTIVDDFTETMPVIKNVAEFISGGDISPSGARVVLEARGDLFSVPAQDGEIRNLTQTQGVREMDPIWSPDGKRIAYLSDLSGMYEIYVRNQDGSGNERRLTQDGDVWRFPPVWAPDSVKLAYADKNQRLRIVDTSNGSVMEVDTGKYKNLTEFAWSSDSQWLAFTRQGPNGFNAIWVYELESGTKSQLTSQYINNFSPSFSPDGKYLFFLSSRDYSLTFGGYEFTYLYTNPNRIYAATLKSDTVNPLAPKTDEEEISDKEGSPPKDAPEVDTKKDKKKKKGKKDKEPSEPSLHTDQFEARVFVLPLSAGPYRGLTATEEGVMYLKDGELSHFRWEDRKAKMVLKNVRGYTLAAKGKKILVRRGNHYGIAANKPKSEFKKLNLKHMDMEIDPKREWMQIYRDANRLIRDWFYDPNMHGYNWTALVAKYQPLVEAAVSRADLDFIMGELGGELNAGHFYVNSGDQPNVKRRPGGLLGAEVKAHESGYYQITKILESENWHQDFRSPLRAVGVNVKEGDFILAIDGQEVKTDQNFYRFLENKGDRVVSLLTNNEPNKEGAVTQRVKTITRETNLRYLDWVKSRQAYVDKASGGRVGYLHMPNTAFAGNRELFKHFYAQMHKDALIIDDRYNGGGFIPFNMIELLERPVLSYWAQRGIEPFRSPAYAHTGPKVCLMNGQSSSGGDAFPHYFRERGLGKLIGTRTWGGLIGLQGNPGFIDGGSLSIPVFRIFDEEGNWLIENEGVSPDIEVIDSPHLVARGEDPSLEAAVKLMLDELENNPPKKRVIPVPPDESK